MAQSRGPKDLLGRDVRLRRPRYEVALERHEIASVPERAERIRWLSTVIPKSSGYVMPVETMRVFQEAKDCFIYGQFVATVVLAASFAEHWLGSIVTSQGFPKVSAQGLSAIVDYCRANDVLPAVVCDKLDVLRQIRNPFVHLKAHDHPHGLGQRMINSRTHPITLLERDSRDALIAMYSVATYARSRI